MGVGGAFTIYHYTTELKMPPLANFVLSSVLICIYLQVYWPWKFILFVLFVFIATTAHPLTSSISTSSSVKSGLLPCSYRGTLILHADSLRVDECTTCLCDNATVKCDIKSCRQIWCDEPIKFEGECCDVCPHCK